VKFILTAIAATLWLSLAFSASAQGVDPARLDLGAKVYGSLCTTCHGPAGDLVAGVNLSTGQFKRAANDLDVMNVILKGVPGTAMPANNLGNADLLAVVAYIKVMKDYGARKVAVGDATKGKAVFENAGGCLSCHRVNHVGSYLGPDLSEIGGARSAAMLEDTLMDPVSNARPGNRSIRAVTKTGAVVTGRRLNEDTWSVQIVDSNQKLVSLWKPDLKDYTVIKSTMPSYSGKLTAADRADLIAYLLSLRPPSTPPGGPGGRGAAPGAGRGGQGRGAAQ
jgi:putative heme-binding domain-containing protein